MTNPAIRLWCLKQEGSLATWYIGAPTKGEAIALIKNAIIKAGGEAERPFVVTEGIEE